jgi:hypothetical protein
MSVNTLRSARTSGEEDERDEQTYRQSEPEGMVATEPISEEPDEPRVRFEEPLDLRVLANGDT